MGQESSVLDRDTIERLQPVIDKLVQQYQADADSAEAEFRSTTRVVRGFENEATAREFTIAVDEPEGLGGTNKGPNPVELLLAALGTCQQIVISAYAAALNIELERLEIDTRGTIDLRGLFNVAQVPAGFREIRFDVNLAARNATEEQLEQLKALALAHCPVLDTLQREIPVQSRYSWSVDAAAARRSA